MKPSSARPSVLSADTCWRATTVAVRCRDGAGWRSHRSRVERPASAPLREDAFKAGFADAFLHRTAVLHQGAQASDTASPSESGHGPFSAIGSHYRTELLTKPHAAPVCLNSRLRACFVAARSIGAPKNLTVVKFRIDRFWHFWLNVRGIPPVFHAASLHAWRFHPRKARSFLAKKLLKKMEELW
jgi:hypothetical protein